MTSMMQTTFVVTLIAMTLFMLGLCARILLLKDGQFHGTCSTNNEFLRQQGEDSCPFCGKEAGEICPNQSTSDED